MREDESDKFAMPWHVPVAVEDLAEEGRHFALVADANTREAVARIAGLRELSRLEADFDVTREGAGGVRVTGRVSATVGQNCVVTLEPLANAVEEEVDVLFVPPRNAGSAGEEEHPDGAFSARVPGEEPEPLLGGIVDLGALATEFLLLGIDPYPRKAGAVFEAPREPKPDPGPFAALAGLTKDRDGR